ncbi:MAG TPA: discoidin domain-containing protein, partial [Pyrinomonadaceae bacterium]|nr:discoidin domain-containing protein [Pyrinomonadaceae bacterium]
VPPLCRGVNYALASNGGVTTASSSTTANFPPSAANNGDRRGLDFGGGEGKGTWGSQASQPQWLQIDFNGMKTIEEINVVTLQDNYNTNPVEPSEAMTFTLYGLQDFRVEYWNGSEWALVPVQVGYQNPVVGNNRVLRRFRFAPLTTTKVRVFSTRAPMQISRIVELEALGCPR